MTRVIISNLTRNSAMLCPRCGRPLSGASGHCAYCGGTGEGATHVVGMVEYDTTGLPPGASFGPSMAASGGGTATKATAPRHWLPSDLEAAVKAAVDKMLADGRLVDEAMPKSSRFRKGRGLRAVPI